MSGQEPIKTVDTDGTIRYKLANGKCHRLDGPAVEWADGSRFWYVDGKRHRLDGPASERANGNKAWFSNNVLHRLDGPAVERASGSKSWWVNDKKVNFWFVWNLASRENKLKLLRYLPGEYLYGQKRIAT